MREPLVTALVAAYNAEPYIAEALHSALDQDWPADKLQIVAVNYGSTDATLAEMRQVAATAQGRVRVIDFPRNRGKRAEMARPAGRPAARR